MVTWLCTRCLPPRRLRAWICRHCRVRNRTCESYFKKLIAVVTDPPVDESTIEYPEGGRQAWLVVLGAWCAMVPAMGNLNTLAILDAWVSKNQLHNLPPSTVGWIFSVHAFCLYFCGAQVGKIAVTNGSLAYTVAEHRFRFHLRQPQYPLAHNTRLHWQCGCHDVFQCFHW